MFEQATRQNMVALPTQTFTEGSRLSWQLPKVGLLSRILLMIKGTNTVVLGGGSAVVNNAGYELVNWASLKANSGTSIVDCSGLGLKFIKDTTIFGSGDYNIVPVLAAANAWTVVVEVPVMANKRDAVGLVNLQNPQTQLSLDILCGAIADAVTLAGGATQALTAATIQPIMEFYTIPANPADFPNLTFLHQWLEFPTPVTGTGDVFVRMQTGNIYQRIIHRAILASAASDSIDQIVLKYNQSESPYVLPKDIVKFEMLQKYGQAADTGIFALDFASQGMPLAAVGQTATRDFINSANITDLTSILTVNSGVVVAAGDKIVTLTEQLIPLL